MPVYDNWNSWLSDYSCLYHMSSGKTERGNENCCSSALQEDEVTSTQIWFPGSRSPCFWISSGQEEIQSIHLLDLHVVACTIHSASVLVSPWLPWVQFIFWCQHIILYQVHEGNAICGVWCIQVWHWGGISPPVHPWPCQWMVLLL